MPEPYVLLIEDNEADVARTREAFEALDDTYDLRVVHSGDEAIAFLEATGPHAHRDSRFLPHAIILDLGLPGMDGYELLRRIRSSERTVGIPVVVLSGTNDPANVTASYAAGANSFIRKPSDLDDFFAAIRGMSEYWVRLNQIPGFLHRT